MADSLPPRVVPDGTEPDETRSGASSHGDGPHGDGPHGEGPHGEGPHGDGLHGDARPAGRRGRGALRERARSGGGSGGDKRSPRALAISIGLHFAAGVLLLELLTFGHGLSSFFVDKSAKPVEERLTFVTPPEPEVAPAATPAPTPAVRATTAAPPVRPPTTGPALGAPAAQPPQPVATRPDTGSGAPPGDQGVGALDPNLRGVKPGYTDVRVWRGAGGGGAGVAAGRSGAERLDSVMAWAITSVADSLDSLSRAQGRVGRKPGDWTRTDASGDKWGWDQMGIRLGKVMIPNALLTLLPLNAQRGMTGNMTAFEREKRLAASREDILRMSERSQGEAEFQKLNKELRQRREKERRDRLRAPDASIAPAKPIGSGTPDR